MQGPDLGGKSAATLDPDTAAAERREFLREQLGEDHAVEVVFLEEGSSDSAVTHSLSIEKNGKGFIVHHSRSVGSEAPDSFAEYTVTRLGKIVEEVPVQGQVRGWAKVILDGTEGFSETGGETNYLDTEQDDSQWFDKLVARGRAGDLEMTSRTPLDHIGPSKGQKQPSEGSAADVGAGQEDVSFGADSASVAEAERSKLKHS
jgi:hypothetical protein